MTQEWQPVPLVSTNAPNAAVALLLALYALEIDPQYQHAPVQQVLFFFLGASSSAILDCVYCYKITTEIIKATSFRLCLATDSCLNKLFLLQNLIDC